MPDRANSRKFQRTHRRIWLSPSDKTVLSQEAEILLQPLGERPRWSKGFPETYEEDHSGADGFFPERPKRRHTLEQGKSIRKKKQQKGAVMDCLQLSISHTPAQLCGKEEIEDPGMKGGS